MTKKEHQSAMSKVIEDVIEGTDRQIKKWGFNEHTHQEWKAILSEELAKMETEVVVGKTDGYLEGVQVAAVMMSWLRNLKAAKTYHDKMMKIVGFE